jgi:hypothetical protein
VNSPSQLNDLESTSRNTKKKLDLSTQNKISPISSRNSSKETPKENGIVVRDHSLGSLVLGFDRTVCLRTVAPHGVVWKSWENLRISDTKINLNP